MPKIAIVTESSSCIPGELVKKYDIKVVPHHIHFQDGVYLDDVDLKTVDFYKMQREAKESGKKIPTTVAATPADWLKAYQEVRRKADTIIALTLSRDLSPACEWAIQAGQQIAPFPVEVVDSRTIGGALAFMVLAAARAAQAGKSPDEVIQVIENMKPRANFIAMVETLYYLAKGDVLVRLRLGLAPCSA